MDAQEYALFGLSKLASSGFGLQWNHIDLIAYATEVR